MPWTLFKSSKRLNRFSLTSEDSSLKRARNIGNMCSLELFLSIKGHNAKMFSARLLLTY